jgi:GntR family transcriptional regulator
VADGAVERLRVQEREIFLTKVWPRIRGIIGRLDIALDELLDREMA